MNKKDKRAIRVVLKELHRRLPTNNNKGFLPSKEVSEAMEYLGIKAFEDIHKSESNTLKGMIKQTMEQ